MTGIKAKDFGLHREVIRRWRDKLKDPQDYNDSLERVHQKCMQIAELFQAASYSSATNEWYTPKIYMEAVRAVLGEIDLDPASNETANITVQAKEFFSRDGLEREWFGRVFLNPPYGTQNGKSVAAMFCNKAIAEVEVGRVEQAIILVNSLHSQKWQEPLYGFPVCFVNHRIKFFDSNSTENPNPTFQNIFIYCGENVSRFAEVFSEFGYVMEHVNV